MNINDDNKLSNKKKLGSRDSSDNTVAKLWTGGFKSLFPAVVEGTSFHQRARTTLGPSQPPTQRLPRVCSAGKATGVSSQVITSKSQGGSQLEEVRV